MLGLPKADEDLAELLTGAYSICMMPDSQTCMNVIVGRHPAGSGFAVDKFSLYYPNNEIMYQKHGNNWPLLQGYSFRTAVLNGVLNRAGLDLRWRLARPRHRRRVRVRGLRVHERKGGRSGQRSGAPHRGHGAFDGFCIRQ